MLRKCDLGYTPLAIRKFAPEIRALIFKHAMDDYFCRTPNLLKAFRGDQELSFEALDVFTTNSTFRVHRYNGEGRELMSGGAWKNIRNISMM
jgi:hypothetical protein